MPIRPPITENARMSSFDDKNDRYFEMIYI